MDQVQTDTKPIYKKWWFWATGVVVFFFVIGMVAGDEEMPIAQNQQAVQSAQETDSINDHDQSDPPPASTITFDVLREWYPDNDTRGVGLEILVDEADASVEEIISLVNAVSSDTSKAVIKIYQDRQAWEEEKDGRYTDIYDRGYLAFYVKNLTSSGAYQGLNEIRWFQETGQLEDLFGTVTRI